MKNWINKFFNVRPGEWSRLLLFALILVLVNVGPNWGITVSYAAFLKGAGLKGAGLETLIWVLLLNALLSIPVMAIYTAFVDRTDNNRLFILINVIGGIVVLFGIFLLTYYPNALAYPLLYVVSLIWGSVFNAQFFTYVNELYDIQSAKRVLPLILAAGRIGAALAGFSIGFLRSHTSAIVVIWIWFISDLLVAGFIILLHAQSKGQKATSEIRKTTAPAPKGNFYINNLREGLNFTLQSRFLRWMAAGTGLLAILLALLEYNTNKILEPLAPSEAAFSGWLGILDGVSNLIALFILLFGLSRLTKAWGIGNTSMIYPSGMFLVSTSLVAVPIISSISGIIPASFAYLTRKGLRFGLQISSEAMLYNAVPLRIKGRARAFASGLIAPVGGMIGVLLFAVDVRFGSILPWFLPTVLALATIAYVTSSLVIRNEYTRALVKMLEEEDYSFLLSDEATEMTAADPATLQRLQKKLDESANHEMRVFMTQLIAQVGGTEALSILVPTIKNTREGRTKAAMLNVVEAAGLRGEKLRELYVELLVDDDAQVRLASAQGLEQQLWPNDSWLQGIMVGMLDDQDDQVSLHALQTLANSGEFYKFDAAVNKLDQLLHGESATQTRHALDILGKVAQPQSIEQLLNFLDHDNDLLRLEAMLVLENMNFVFGNALHQRILEKVRPLSTDPVARIRQAVLVVIGKSNAQADYPLLVSALADKNPQVRTTAANIFVKIGNTAVPMVQANLKSTDAQLHKMAAVILSRINPRQFGSLIEDEAFDSLSKIYQAISLEQALSAHKKHPSTKLLLASINETNRALIEEILYLLSAIHDAGTLKVIRESLDSDSSSTRNLALEALESLTSPRTAMLIASLFDPSISPEQLITLGHDHWHVEQVSLVQAFDKMLCQDDDRTLQLLAIHAIRDICTELPVPKKPARRGAQLLMMLETPAEPQEQPVNSHDPSSDLRNLLKKMLQSPDALVQQAAQDALTQIAGHGKTSEATAEELRPLSVIDRMIILKAVQFFRNIPISQLEMLAMVCEEKQYAKGTRIFKKGDPGGVLYIMANGQVGIEQEKRGGSALLATLEKDSYFGEMTFFDNSPQANSAVTTEDSRILLLQRAPVTNLTAQDPDLALELINVLSQRIRETSDKLADAARSRPRELHKLYDQFN